MFKNKIFAGAVLFSALGLYACKEQPVGIFKGQNAVDSTYVTTPETAQTKNFYIEEFSGVRCVNCPAGAEKLEALSQAHPNLLKIVTIHAGALTTPDYTKGSKQDLRSGKEGKGEGLNLLDLVYGGDVSKPAASFDRMNIATGSNPLIGDQGQWDAMLSAVKAQNSSTPINMYLTSTYDAANDEYNIRVKMSYTQNIAEPHFLSIFLTESKINDKQIEPLKDFQYNHVFRKAITPINGIKVLDSIPSKAPGRVWVTNYKLKIDTSDSTIYKQKFWNVNNMHVVAFVHKATSATDKKVMQVVDAPLK